MERLKAMPVLTTVDLWKMKIILKNIKQPNWNHQERLGAR